MAVRRAPSPLDSAAFYGEYPFLPGAETLVADAGWTVRSLFEDPAYEAARALGRARVLAASEDPRGHRLIAELASASADVRYLSFLFARLVLSAAPSPAGLRRWAVAESKRSSTRLEGGVETSDELETVARKLRAPMTLHGAAVEVPLPDYVRLVAGIREADFRLARQEVSAGLVRVRPSRAARLLEEAIRRELAHPLPLTDEVVAWIRARETELLSTVAERTPRPVARAGGPAGGLRPDLFPPCVRKMARTLEKGENLSHSGRFCLAAFLHRAGADEETIVDHYRGAPDFDESITRYQVEHITQRDGGRGYEPPECETLRSHGLCARDGDPQAANPAERSRDPLCYQPWLRHPLQYYRTRGGSVVESGEGDGRPATAERSGGATGRPGAPARSRSTGRR